MSKRISVISASLRKGRSFDTLYDELIRGIQESGDQAKKIFLVSGEAGYCTGCGICNITHKCVRKDEMAEILGKMMDADVIVLATPAYFYTIDAQMKTLTNHAVSKYTEIQNKDFYFIVVAADTKQKMMGRIIEGSRGFTQDHPTGVREKGIIYGTGTWQVGEVKGTPVMK